MTNHKKKHWWQPMKKEIPIWILLAVPFVILVVFWDRFPDVVPIHWDLNGEPDNTASKTVGLLLLPVINVALYGLFWLIPKIDPKQRLSGTSQPLPALRNMMVVLMTFIFLVTTGAMLGIEGFFGIRNLLPLGIVLLFFGLGHYLPSIQPNYFIGIRTPWTLQDEDIWQKTHQLAGKIWVYTSGLLVIGWAFLEPDVFSRVFIWIGLSILAGVPIVYSFILWMKKKKDSASAE